VAIGQRCKPFAGGRCVNRRRRLVTSHCDDSTGDLVARTQCTSSRPLRRRHVQHFCAATATQIDIFEYISILHVFFCREISAPDTGSSHRALGACIAGPPDNWRRRIGRPRQSWLRTVEADLRSMNLGLAIAKRRAQEYRSAWRNLVAAATSSQTRS